MRNPPAFPPSSAARRSALAWGLFALLCGGLLFPNMVLLHVQPLASAYGAMGLRSGLAGAVLIPIGIWLCLLALFGRCWVVCLLMAPMAACMPLVLYYIMRYGYPLTAEIIAVSADTNAQETFQYFGHSLIWLVAGATLGVGVALAGAWTGWRSRAGLHGARMRLVAGTLGTAILVVPIVAGAMAQVQRHPGEWRRGIEVAESGFIRGSTEWYPFGSVHEFVRYRRIWGKMRAGGLALAKYHFDIIPRAVHATSGQQVYVLVIGESSAREHWSLFGYPRATTPELAGTPGVVKFPRFLSQWPFTIAAVPALLTRKPGSEMWTQPWKEGSIVNLMQDAGFHTWWISNQFPVGYTDSPIALYAYTARHVQWLNLASLREHGSYDDVLAGALKKALARDHGNLFIVLHMIGNHQAYDDRYPTGFRRWLPVVSSPASAGGTYDERMHNSYDNSVLYSDHVLASLIGILRDHGSQSALMFESDHGELLPSGGCTEDGHGAGTIHEYKIPAFIWTSATYASAHPERMAMLRQHADARMSSADTFETLAGLAGINFRGSDPSRDLAAAAWTPHPRYVGVAAVRRRFSDMHAIGACGMLEPLSRTNATGIGAAPSPPAGLGRPVASR